MFGQFFTITNPFDNDLFYKYVNLIEDFSNKVILEPFCGSNNIVKMINDLGFENKWKCFDINKQEINNFPKYSIEINDSLLNYPKGYKVAITNPPYLAKNSATKNGIKYMFKYDDLYKESLSIMLENTDFVVAIIPESFINQGLFHERLYGVSSLTVKMFEDTDCPVCLALFIPKYLKEKLFTNNDFMIYKNSGYLGNYNEIIKKKIFFTNGIKFSFNSPNGKIGLIGIDSVKGIKIKFVKGEDVDSTKIKPTSRGITRINSDCIENMNENEIFELIEKCNSILELYRQSTNDVFLTSFKGLREDGYYRRRLDFKTANTILNMALQELKEKNA